MIRHLRKNMPRTWQHIERSNWTLADTHRSHPAIVHEPSGRRVTLPTTPSDPRTDLNMRARLWRIEREVEHGAR